MATQELISIREYARRRGCSDVAVGHAIRKGKIQKGVAYKPNGKIAGIHPDIADKEWGENRRPSYKRNEQLAQQLDRAAGTPTVEGGAPPPPADTDKKGFVTRAEADRAKAIFDAKIRELSYKEKLGQLVDKQKTYRMLFTAGQELSSNILAIPARVTDEMRALEDRNQAEALLYSALADVLEKLGEIMQREI